MNELPIMMFFDESGTIPIKRMNKIFVVTCVMPTEEEKKIQNRFKRWKRKYCAINNLNMKDEVKGSHMKDDDILSFINHMKKDLKIIYAWFNANNLNDERWLQNSKLTHNYLIWLATEKAIQIQKHKDIKIKMQIDIMNNPTKGIKSLEDYMNSKLLFDSDTGNKVSIQYNDSKHYINIQIADIFSHFIYRNLKHKTQNVLDNMPEFFERKIY